MKGEYRIVVPCPFCKKKVTVLSNSINGNCPECDKAIPALRLFISNGIQDKQHTTVSLVQEQKVEKPKNEKIKRHEMKAGIVITSQLFGKQEFIIMRAKKGNGNKVFYCLPIIEEGARTKTDRFVNKLEEGKLVVFNKEERLFDYNVKPVRQLPEKTFERLRLSYEKFLASTPNEQAVERHNVVPHDGFRSGNAWEGIASVPGHIKVYRG